MNKTTLTLLAALSLGAVSANAQSEGQGLTQSISTGQSYTYTGFYSSSSNISGSLVGNLYPIERLRQNQDITRVVRENDGRRLCIYWQAGGSDVRYPEERVRRFMDIFVVRDGALQYYKTVEAVIIPAQPERITWPE